MKCNRDKEDEVPGGQEDKKKGGDGFQPVRAPFVGVSVSV